MSGPRGFGVGLRTALLYLLLIWAVFIVNAMLFQGNLLYYGIHPRETSTIWHIFTSPLLHANYTHLVGNSFTGAFFCFLVAYSGKRVFWEVTTIVTILGGLGVWFFGGVGTNHVGASGLIYGWLAYLIIRGIFNRSFSQFILGAFLAMTYSGLVWGIFPGTPGVSWQAHLFGALAGVVAGAVITSDDPPKLQRSRGPQQPTPQYYQY